MKQHPSFKLLDFYCHSEPGVLRGLPGQIGSATQRARNGDTHHSWQGASPLPGPRVIHKHDGLAVIFLHLQHKRMEWDEGNESRESVLVSDAP